MIGYRWTHPLTGMALLLLSMWATVASSSESTRSPVHVVLVEFRAGQVQFFRPIELPWTVPLPTGAVLALRYCSNGQARLLSPKIDGNRLQAIAYIPPYSRLCVEVAALSPPQSTTDPALDGFAPVDPKQNQEELDRITQLFGPMDTINPDAETGLPVWISYLMVLIGFAGLGLAIAYAILHQVKRLRELSGLVRQLQQAQHRTVGFILKELRVESLREGSGEDAKIKIYASDGYQEQSMATTKRRADILRELLQRHPDPVSRFGPNETELINPTELTRLRKDLAPLLGTLLALQLIKNSENHVSLNPTLYCPPEKSPRLDA